MADTVAKITDAVTLGAGGEKTLKIPKIEMAEPTFEGTFPGLDAALKTKDEAAFQARSDAMSAEFDTALKSLKTMADPLVKGEIPKDVIEQIRIASAEKSTQGGFGATSQMGRNLQARDFGLTSLQLQEKGAALTQTVGQLSAAKYEMDTKLGEARYEFNQSLRLQARELMDNVRKTGLQAATLELERMKSNQTAALAINEMISKVAMFREELQSKYALEGAGGKAAGSLSTMDSLLSGLKSLWE